MHTAAPAADYRRAALSVLALALRPVEAEGRVKFTRATRRDLYRAAESGLSARAFYAALDIFDDPDNVAAIRPTSHARVIRYDVTPIRDALAKGRTTPAIAAWHRILDAAGIADDLATLAASLVSRGIDIETPLPETFRPDVASRYALPEEKRCTRCQKVKHRDDFTHNGDRLASRCNPCRAEDAKAWRRDNPDKVRRANRWRGRAY